MLHSRLTGNDLHAPSRETVINTTGSLIPALKVVRVTGMGTSFPTIDIANPNLYQNFGITFEDIANNIVGKVCCLGFVFGVNTSTWAVNTILYSDVSGNLSAIALGAPVATVVKQDATTGVLYVTAISDQITPPSGVDWGLSGNSISLGSFLGTINNQDLVIKTNNTQKAVFDVNGRFGLGVSAPVRQVELKTHNTIPSTGIQMESFDVTTNSSAYQDMYFITLSDPSSVLFEISVQGKDSITGDLCSFKRYGSFYRNAGSVILMPQGWQSTFTSKTNNSFNISYSINVTDVVIRVKAATGNLTNWTGYITLQELKI